jgi:hypothetical protein
VGSGEGGSAAPFSGEGGGQRLGLGERRQPKRGGEGSRSAEGRGLGGWAKNRRWAQAQKEILFTFQLILEFGRTLKNCTRRFRKKSDMEIFPKIF